ncbi:MAG: galactonate dehydratase [Thermoguttaceae bacterium]|nr:galactonate dehydratase [Thermoguttaceae bacterium]
MKITKIETFICNAYRTNWCFIRVLTDQPGLYGLGEATLEYKEQTVIQACRELERDVLGRDPRDIESIWQDLYRNAYWRGGPVLMSAISALDMALWDILGKDLGVPVWRLLGGKVRDRVPCYANGWFVPAKTPEEFGEKAAEAVASGFRALKWDPFGSAWRYLSPQAFREAIRCVEAVYQSAHGKAEILIEGHGRFELPTAIRIAQALEPFDVMFFEEPLIPDSLEAMADFRSKVRVPVAFGERLYGLNSFRTLLEYRAADLVQPDVSHAGGLTELKKIAALADSHHLPILPHNPSGPIANAATLQLAASTPNFLFLETMASDVPWRREICDETIRIENGDMLIPDRPGLGVDLNESEIAKHPFIPTSLRHYRGDLTDIRPKNAVSISQN